MNRPSSEAGAWHCSLWETGSTQQAQGTCLNDFSYIRTRFLQQLQLLPQQPDCRALP